MCSIVKADSVYPAIDELVVELRFAGETRLASILHHRVHQVAWTTKAELFDELKRVLEANSVPIQLRDRVDRILAVITAYVEEPRSSGSEPE